MFDSALETSLVWKRQDDPGWLKTLLSSFCHTVAGQHFLCRPNVHRFLPELSIVQDDRIDNCPTLHTTLRGKLELAGAVQ
jgi:hypothetical protein